MGVHTDWRGSGLRQLRQSHSHVFGWRAVDQECVRAQRRQGRGSFGQRLRLRLRRLAAIQLAIVSTQAKFKVGPATPPADARQRTVTGLRARNAPGDARAADVIEAAIADPPDRRNQLA